MSFAQIVELGVATTLAAVTLVAALMTWRVLGSAGRGLRAADVRLSQLAATIPERTAQTRAQLKEVDVAAEHALWLLGNLDARMDSVTVDLLAKRVASDRLRLQLIDGRLTVARIRQLARLLIRIGDLRRAFL